MLVEYKHWSDLTEKEQGWIIENRDKFDNLASAIESGAKPKKENGACANTKRVEILKDIVKLLNNPTNSCDDNPNEIVYNEERNLGVAISYARVDSCDTSRVNCSCKEFLSGRKGFLILGVVIQSIREVKIKKGKSTGKKMAFLTIADGSCSISDVCVFPDAYNEFCHLLNEGNTVLLQGERDSKKDSFVVKQVWQF